MEVRNANGKVKTNQGNAREISMNEHEHPIQMTKRRIRMIECTHTHRSIEQRRQDANGSLNDKHGTHLVDRSCGVVTVARAIGSFSFCFLFCSFRHRLHRHSFRIAN